MTERADSDNAAGDEGLEEQRSVHTEALAAELGQCRDERDKALAARDALVQQLLVPSAATSKPRGSGARRGLVAAVVLLLVVAGGLLFYQVVWTNRLLQRTGRPGLGDPAGRRRYPAKLMTTGRLESVRLDPRRAEAIPVAGLNLLGRAAISPDGRLVALAGLRGQIQLYDLARDRVARQFRAHRGTTRDLVFSSDGKALFSGGSDGAIHRWLLPRGARTTLRAKGAPVRRLAIHGLRLAVAAEHPNVEVVSTSSPAGSRQQLKGHTGWIRALTWSPDGRVLASGGHDGSVRLWSSAGRSATLKAERVLSGHGQWISALDFETGGRRLASAGFDKRIRIWRVADGALLGELRGHVRRVTDLAFRRGQLASASLDRTVRIWQVAPLRPSSGWRQRALFEGHRYQVNTVLFLGPNAGSRRASHLLTASGDGMIRIWPINAARPTAATLLPPPRPGELTLRNNTSGERLRVQLLDTRGRMRDEAITQLARFLRSGADDRTTAPDPALVKLLYGVAEHFGRQREVVVISGSRSPEYNRLRRTQSRQVGEQSYHLEGKAIDFRIEGVTITALHKHLRSLKAGGVGFYPDSQFVHMDVGPVRTWQGD